MFEDLGKLATLSIGFPGYLVPDYIITFDQDWLQPLRRLRFLDLTGINVAGFSPGQFCRNRLMKNLTLTHTLISSTEGLGIQSPDLKEPGSTSEPCLPNLTHLDISFDNITVLNLTLGTDMPMLKVLNVQNCSVSQFLGLDSLAIMRLQYLDLSNNSLSLFYSKQYGKL